MSGARKVVAKGLTALKTAKPKVINKIYSESDGTGKTRLFPSKTPKNDADLKFRIDQIFFNPITREKMIAVQLNDEVSQKDKDEVLEDDTHENLAVAVLKTHWKQDQDGERGEEWKEKVDNMTKQVLEKKPLAKGDLGMVGYKEAKEMAKMEREGGRRLSRSEKRREKEAAAAEQSNRGQSKTRSSSKTKKGKK